MGMFDFDFDTFDLEAFKQEHPDLVVRYPHYIAAIERAKESGEVDVGAISSVEHLRFKADAKFRAGLRAARQEANDAQSDS